MNKAILKFFDVQELVCRHVYNTFGLSALNFLDEKLLETLLFVRENIGKPIYVNNWQIGGNLSQRGLRCNLCDLVKSKTNANSIYVSAHVLGKAVDFDVKGMKAEEVRQWLLTNENRLPHPIRLEKGVSWVHMDVRTFDGSETIKWFTA